MSHQVTPLSAAIGAEFHGADLSKPIADLDFSEIFDAWVTHLVLLFRDQHLQDPELAAFSRRFGTLDAAPPNEASNKHNGAFVAGMPEVTVVSNVIQNGVPIGALGADESSWHTDMSYMPRPPSASILYGLETPPSGGDARIRPEGAHASAQNSRHHRRRVIRRWRSLRVRYSRR